MKLAAAMRLTLVLTASSCLLLAVRPAAADLAQDLQRANIKALQRAIEDLVATFGDRYGHGREFLKQAADYEKQATAIEASVRAGDAKAAQGSAALATKIEALRREALMANPLLDFDKLLLVRRRDNQMGLPQNWQGNCSLPQRGYDNQIAVLSPVRPGGKIRTLLQPKESAFVGDVELHPSATKMLFSMPSPRGRWQIYELGTDGRGLRQVSDENPPDVDNYDPCYLPDGRIIFCSSRCFHGVPCVGGGDNVANLFIMDADGTMVRQLTFDQDHDWCPAVLNNGRVLYTRWEYSDTPHYFTRLLFSMNPDGTNQAAYYHSNSYWPNSTFYARPIPGHPTKVVAVISGHHGVQRMGELVIFDPAKGRFEEQGAIQRIPGFEKKVEPIIRDGLVEDSWPRFLHPYPLSEKYFLVSCKPTPNAPWGIYLVDTFDNFVLLADEPGYAMLEPVPLRKTATPPVIPDRVNLTSDQAEIHISDVYSGEGMRGVPRGAVKKLRVYEPVYAYPGMGGHINIGIDGPWDGRRIWGTVPVDSDGSASFKAPANTPLAVQPLDAQGETVAVMRSWFAAMPGEVVSCTGCHESQNQTPLGKPRMAVLRKPSEIEPWYGPPRGMSFKREVQPVLDKYCVGCHQGTKSPPDLRVDGAERFRNFTPSYVALHPFVRRPGPESDYHLQKPMEWYAGTSELVQMIEKGHHNVQLDREAWDRLITWIDLNVPDQGTWHEHASTTPVMKRRLEMRKLYASRPEDPEEIIPTLFEGAELKRSPVAFVTPPPERQRDAKPLAVRSWPFDATEAAQRQKAVKLPQVLKLELASGPAVELVLIPAGEFVMGSTHGAEDEYPPAAVKITRPFYMSRTEITNSQFAAFDPQHDSAVISMPNKDQDHRGFPINEPAQPIVRVTWQHAQEFCKWVSARTGRRANLPTEAQWEWAARAGTDTATYYGDERANFGRFANLADASLRFMARGDSPQWHPRINAVDDGAMVTTSVGHYQPNAWGLRDMIGNAAEWTRTAYRPYPYNAGDGRDDPAASGAKVARGGSWYDRPFRATASYRKQFQPWQPVFDVGFRIIVEAEEQIVSK
jgi:formylglycine-generating enzyme required for sulfatase activity